jgi:HlyD family secretion protein
MILGVVAALAAGAAGAAWWLFRPAATNSGLEANGQIRGDEITISSKVTGVADLVALREGQQVSKGELLVQIAARDLEARLEQARAQLSVARNLSLELDAQLEGLAISSEQAKLGAGVARGTAVHEIHRADEAYARAKAQVTAAESQVERDRASNARFAKLLEQGFVSRAYFEEVAARYATSEANLLAARKGLEEALATQEKARAASGEATIREKDVPRLAAERARLLAAKATAASQEQVAEARVRELEALLADARILSPADATVIAKLVQPGELVAGGRPLATLVDLRELYVRVYVPERDIGRVRLGDAARIRIDAFPNRDFAGTVVEIAQRAEFTPKEVHVKDERVKLVFGVKVRIANPEGFAKPGMPADVTIAAAANA